ncbi:MAG: cadherin-like beta sandwich domain-containing protein [Lachnospiraceae bacterium]|nr:cadherin-like beta sandwich domain-containing protein [Lachnospiraceae bacterium]
MRQRRKIAALLLLCILFVQAAQYVQVFAASATIRFFTEDEAVAGTEFTVTLSLESDATIGDFEAYFTYDAVLAEYVSGPACITGGDGYLKVSDMDASPSSRLRNYVMVFRALKRGPCPFRITGVPMVYIYENGNSMSVLSEPYTVEIAAPSDASDNALVSALRISPGTLVPEFSPEITEYETELDADAERLIVSAVPDDAGASVSISGNDRLSDGENHINVTVTAENGNVRVYHIMAVRKAPAPTAEPEPDRDPSQTGDRAFSLERDGEELLLKGVWRYRVAALPEGELPPEGYSADWLLIDGETVAAYMTEPDASFCLLRLENEAGESGWYRFDREEYTVQRYVPEIVTVKDTSDANRKLTELLAKTSEYEKKKNAMSILCGALGAAVVLLIVLCIRFYVRSISSEDEFD